MSGIYIPDMEMPCEEAEPLRIELYADGTVFVIKEQDDFYEFKAVPVPPHGRLIDASALLQSIKEARKAQPEIADVYDDDYFLVAEWVCTSPTIIPASTADKEGEE